LNIQERIQKFRHELNLTTAKRDYVKLVKLEQDIRRFVKKVLRHEGEAGFTSTDLRGLVLQIGKVLSAINKRIEFCHLNERFKKYKIVTDKEFAVEMNTLIEYINTARELQATYSLINYLAVVLDLHETRERQLVENDEQEFNDEILSAITQFLTKERL